MPEARTWTGLADPANPSFMQTVAEVLIEKKRYPEWQQRWKNPRAGRGLSEHWLQIHVPEFNTGCCGNGIECPGARRYEVKNAGRAGQRRGLET